MTFLCTSEKIMILFQLDKGAIENIDERLKESLSIYLKRKEKLQFLKKALYFAPTLGQFTRNYTQTTKRGLLTTNKG